jgi:hypothetical protein
VRTTAYACDRCREPIGAGRAAVAVTVGPRPPGWPTDPETGRPAADLCGPCLDALSAWLSDRPGTPARLS